MKNYFTLLLLLKATLLFSQDTITPKGQSKMKCIYMHTFQPFVDDTTKVNEKFVLYLNDQFSEYNNYNDYLIGIEIKRAYAASKLDKNSSVFDILNMKLDNISEPESNNFKVFKDNTSQKVIYTHGFGVLCSF